MKSVINFFISNVSFLDVSEVGVLADAVASPKCEDEDKDMCRDYKEVNHLCHLASVQKRCPVTCDACSRRRDQSSGTYANILNF